MRIRPLGGTITNVKTPSTIEIGEFTISKFERSSSGDGFFERINDKRNFDLTWNYLSRSDMVQMKTPLRPGRVVQLEIHNTETDELEWVTCYTGDRRQSFHRMDTNDFATGWENVTLMLVEL